MSEYYFDPRYIPVMVQMVQDERLEKSDLPLYITIACRYSQSPGNCNSSQRQWAWQAHIANGVVGKSLQRLEAAGYIVVHPTSNGGSPLITLPEPEQGRAEPLERYRTVSTLQHGDLRVILQEREPPGGTP